MKVFISWSGDQSKYIAQKLSEWIEQVLQSTEPWISTDIEKGKRWNPEIAGNLEDSKVGIFCMTPSNLSSEWIHFEAGAISKTKDAYVCTLLYKVTPTDISSALSQFQATKFERDDILKLVKNINTQIGKSGGKSIKEKALERAFDSQWSQLENEMKNVPDSDDIEEPRTEKDLLEESLNILRFLKNSVQANNISESDMDEIVDWWIEKYASNKKIDHNNSQLDGHTDKIYDFMIIFPEIQKIFTSSSHLKSRITSQINDLLPF